MGRRLLAFFRGSVRSKLLVALPLVIAFVLSFHFLLSIFSLRTQVLDQLIFRSQQHVDLLAKKIDAQSTDVDLRPLLSPDHVMYIRIFNYGRAHRAAALQEELSVC